MKLLKLLTAICTAALSMSALHATTIQKNVVVNTAVLDMRVRLFSETNPTLPEELVSQALFGETMTAIEENGGWYHVISNEQTWSSNGSLKPVEGWVIANRVIEVPTFPSPNIIVVDPLARMYSTIEFTEPQPYELLSVGTKLVGEDLKSGWWFVRMPNGSQNFISEDHVVLIDELNGLPAPDVRIGLINLGMKLVNTPYVQGGRSVHSNYILGESTGMDGGSFVDLLYRSFNITIPRTPDAQYRAAAPIANEPEKGDLVFFVDPKAGMAIQTMIIVHDDLLLECTGLTNSVRTISATERLGRPIHKITSGDVTENSQGFQVFFGSFMNR